MSAPASTPTPSPSPGSSRSRRPGPPARVACVHLPHLALAVAVRDEPRLAGRPLAVVSEEGGAPRVRDLSYAAQLSGVLRGMPLEQAQRACHDLVLRPARPADYRDTLRLLLAVLADFTPEVEPLDLEHSWLAASGLAPARGRESALVGELAGAVRRRTGLPARVGLAHGKLTSRILTHYLAERDAMVLPPGREVVFLGGLALRYLPLSDPLLARLRALGLVKVHHYAGLPGAGILPRFGYEGLRAWRLAHGQDESALRPWREEPELEARHAFPEPIANLRSLRHHVGRLAERLAAPLASRFQLASALALRVDFETGEAATPRRELLEPTGQERTLRTHAEALMAQVDWSGPVEALTLRARGLCPTMGRQLSLFREAHEARAEVDAALRDLQGRYGEEVVRRGRVLDADAPLHERRAVLEAWG